MPTQPLETYTNRIRSKHVGIPMLALSIACRRPMVIRHAPSIGDMEWLCTVADLIGDNVSMSGTTLTYVPRRLDPGESLDITTLRCSLRQSILLAPLAMHIETLSMPTPSGDDIGSRPLDAYKDVLAAFGIGLRFQIGVLTCANIGLPDNADKRVLELQVPSTGVTFVALACAQNAGISHLTIRNASSDPEVAETLLAFFPQQAFGMDAGALSLQCGMRATVDQAAPLDRIALAELLIAAELHGVPQSTRFLWSELRPRIGTEFFTTLEALRDDDARAPTLDLQASQYPGLSTDILPSMTTALWLRQRPFRVTDMIFERRMSKLQATLSAVDPRGFVLHAGGFSFTPQSHPERNGSAGGIWESDNIRQTSSGILALVAPGSPVWKVVDNSQSIFRAYTMDWFEALERITGRRLYISHCATGGCEFTVDAPPEPQALHAEFAQERLPAWQEETS